MDRSFSSGALGTPPAAPGSPSIGYPTAGNPAGSVPATKPGAYWYYMITEELLALVAAAGLTPALGTLTQVRDAMYALFARVGIANVFTKGQAGSVAALPATTGTLAFDFTAASNFSGQVTGDTVMGNGYTTHGAGKATWFSIRVQQSAGTLRNWSFASNWKHVGGSTTIPAQTQTASAWDEIIGQVRTDGTISFAVRSDVK